ncbi:myb-like protein AA [Drosophila guanche]|uniref:Blast:Ras association domain-containing protein 8 n=2 Tax=Drosophila guanche TaxID=7266 RepID=A0A3B0JT42_DROGU|nr:myb-like protein AA [Drosophila guanche]SPP83572.1 blast:Ras association domain-containing protein 8 [Drosophila guanche]
MELKVWVEGIQRIVCGVTVNTTCQDVVFALAHATGKVGRFTLIERWRNNERHLAPNENPMKLLLKWGEYANDVQFILQRSENKAQQQPTQQTQQQQQQQQQSNNNNNNYAVMTTKKPLGPNNSNNNSSGKPAPTLQKQKSNVELSYRTKELKKSFGGYDAKQFDNIGIVKGIPQQQQPQQPPPPNATPVATRSPSPPQAAKEQVPPPLPQLLLDNIAAVPIVAKHEKSLSNPLDMSSSNVSNVAAVAANGYNDLYNNNSSSQNIYSQLSKSSSELRRASPNEMYYSNNNNNNNNNINNNNNNSPELYKQATQIPTISANGALVPPPYRDPPPPRNSPMCQNQRSNADTISNASSSTNPFLSSDYDQHSNHNNNNNNNNSNSGSVSMEEGETMMFQATQYNDLLQLIKFQREKITAQQMELQKFDTEIVYLESKERDHAHELEAISREISKADQTFRQGSEQLQTLQYVEEENELVKQQEKTLKSEIALLRSKLANCETELLQCKNKMRLLMDDIELEQQQQQQSNRQTVERDFLMEMERIQGEIDQALHNTDTSNKTADNLKKELLMIEHAIAEKKRQVEQLVNEMKEVNLQSLTTVTTTEEIKHLLEGQANKQGSSRRIIGSPRQLETAVPTSKNPHGVWV